VTERRKLPRSRTFLGGTISFNKSYSTMSCRIKNMSDQGAMVEFHGTISIPQVFDLAVAQKGRSYVSRIIWRDAERMGVSFENAKLDIAPIPLDLVRRLKSCEEERNALKQRVVKLSEPG
jgi:PilZ domain